MQDPALLEDAVALAPSALGTNAGEPESEITTRQLTQTQLTWIRFRRHKPAMIGLGILLLIILLVVLGPLVVSESPDNIFSYDITNQNLSPRTTPAWFFILGTDDQGHTILSQIIWGGRTSLEIGFISAFLVSLVGTLVGAVSGYFGGWVDTTMMRVTDVVLTLPFLPMLLLAAQIWGQGHLLVIIGIFVVFSWPGVARLTRSSFLTLREQEFAEAARAVGVGNARIIFRHLLPSALRPVLVVTSLNVASFILTEAAIDYLGAGLKYPQASWGNILDGAKEGFSNGNWWWATFPGVVLILTVLSVNFLGDGLGDALDVRSKV